MPHPLLKRSNCYAILIIQGAANMLTYDQYMDKVYGCWLGKCVAGTIGAPYEGMKQLLHLSFRPEMIEKMLPNDDLDLQVLWLKVLEEKGIYTTGDDLAAAFSEYNVFWPGEYAWFKKNYDRGLRPPYTAKYENTFYNEGMGCPIRAEIWGLIVPGNPAIAADLCVMDGTLDHSGNSVYFERFWSAMVAQSFVCSDISELIQMGLQYVPQDSRAYRLITDTVEWCAQYEDYRAVRSRLIAEYGHSDCTNSFVNIGITLTVLLKSGGDCIKAAIMACNCGFDTDCTAGNAGALIGAIYGGKYLEEKSGFADSGYALTLTYKRKTNKIIDLARDTCRVGLHFLEKYPGAQRMVRETPYEPIEYTPSAVRVYQEYPDGVYISDGESKRVTIRVENDSEETTFEVSLSAPEGFTAQYPKTVSVPEGGMCAFDCELSLSADITVLNEVNLFEIALFANDKKYTRKFGLVGRAAYELFGPFWENNEEVDIGNGERNYFDSFPVHDGENFMDKVRFYHLDTTADIHKEYILPQDMRAGKCDPLRYETQARRVCADGDIIEFSKVCPFNGGAVIYLRRIILSDTEESLKLQVGRNCPYAIIWNGETLTCKDDFCNFTPENEHFAVAIKKGENELIVKMCRMNDDCKVTVTFTENANTPKHYMKLNSSIKR